MRSPKDTNFFEEVVSLIDQTSTSGQILHQLFSRLDHGNIPQDIQCVYRRNAIIQLMILLKLVSVKSIHACIRSEWDRLLPMGKDVLYKVRNSPLMPWRSILHRQAKQCLKHSKLPPSDVYRPWTMPCFIVDDTDQPKTGKCIEWIGRIYSHLTGKYMLGFKCLNLALWTGSYLLHLDCSLHVEMGRKGNQGMSRKEAQKRFGKDRKENTPGSVRVQEAFCKKTDQLICMLRAALRKGFSAEYLLADSWFFCEKLVVFALKNNLHLHSRPKFNNWLYAYNGKSYTLGKLVRKLRRSKARKWNRELRLHHLTVSVEYKGQPIRIFFYKEKKRGSKWQAIASTDRSIGAVQAYKVYKNRWSIEVSYKELKQHLGFGKCQARDFNAHIADTTLSLMAYNFLSCIKAVNEYETIGQLFEEVSSGWIRPTIMERFWQTFYRALQAIADLVDKEIEELIEIVMQDVDFFSNGKKWA
jgi:hypothetical protein